MWGGRWKGEAAFHSLGAWVMRGSMTGQAAQVLVAFGQQRIRGDAVDFHVETILRSD